MEKEESDGEIVIRDNTDRYTKQYRMSPDIAIDIFQRQQDPSRPLGSADIESILGWSRGSVHNKLGEAVERGSLATRTVGKRTRVWWIPSRQGTASEEELKPPVPTTIREVQDATYIKGWDKDERAEAVYAAYNLLRRQGRATNEELRSQGVKAYPETDSDSESSEKSHWTNYLRDALSDLPGVEPPARTASMWTYIPPESELDEQLSVEIEDWVPGSDELMGEGSLVNRQQAMIQLAYNLIRETGRVEQSQFKNHLPPYVAHYTDFEQFWARCLSEHLPKGDWIEHGSGVWTYIDPEIGRKLDSVNLDEWVATTPVPGRGDAERRQRACIQLAYDYIRENDGAKSSDIEAALPKYTSYYEKFDGLWNYVIKKAFKRSDHIKDSEGRSLTYTVHTR